MCTKENKKNRGCVRPLGKKRKPVHRFYGCVFCEGLNKKCKYCHGTNNIELRRCAVAMSKKVDYMHRYISRFMEFGVFPDGSMSVLFQPVRLVNALTVYKTFYNKFKIDLLPKV